jgi:hypothetical protein
MRRSARLATTAVATYLHLMATALLYAVDIRAFAVAMMTVTIALGLYLFVQLIDPAADRELALEKEVAKLKMLIHEQHRKHQRELADAILKQEGGYY